MKEMPEINYIKDLREREGLSISEIARRMNIHWNTAKKYADGVIALKDKGVAKRIRPVMGPYEEIIELWIEEDHRMPRKQQRTAKAIYQQLLKETEYKGSPSTVTKYVRKIRQKVMNERQEQYVKLTHNPGTAQIDFGEFNAMDAMSDSIIKYYYLVMSFPYSNVVLARVTPAENTQCFLEAMKSMFEEIKGVPVTIWFDNLSAAVITVLKEGNRELTKAFKEFEWYYRFKACFCNVSKGHEKGHVEGKVGYVRRNWFSPMPIVEDILEFNANLQKELIADRNRPHSTKDEMINDLWLEDKNALLLLPLLPHEIMTTDRMRVNKYNEIKVNSSFYHVPQCSPGQEIFLKIYWDTITIFDFHGEKKIAELPRKYLNQVDKIDWQAELKIFLKKPRAIEHATYIKRIPEEVRTYLLAEKLSLRKLRIEDLITLLNEYSMTEIKNVIKIGLETQRITLGDLQSMLVYQNTLEECKEPLDEPWTPENVLGWKPNLADYNDLCQELNS